MRTNIRLMGDYVAASRHMNPYTLGGMNRETFYQLSGEDHEKALY